MNWKLFTLALAVPLQLFSQVGIGTTTVDNSAALQLNSTSKGILIPRMTTVQRTAIVSPAAGLMVYDNDLSQFFFYNGSSWVQAIGPAGANGTNGKTILSGASVPTAGIGSDGDFYLRTNASRDLYGPKTGTAWPGTFVSLVGPQGPSGISNTVSMNFSYYPDNITVPKGIWVMGPGAKQVTLGTSGALVNTVVSAKIAAGETSPAVVYCNICYGTGAVAPSAGTPVMENGVAELVSQTLNSATIESVSMSAKVIPPSAGTYWIAPCFRMISNLLIFGGMGYIIVLD